MSTSSIKRIPRSRSDQIDSTRARLSAPIPIVVTSWSLALSFFVSRDLLRNRRAGVLDTVVRDSMYLFTNDLIVAGVVTTTAAVLLALSSFSRIWSNASLSDGSERVKRSVKTRLLIIWVNLDHITLRLIVSKASGTCVRALVSEFFVTFECAFKR